MAEQLGVNLNSFLDELQAWEEQLRHLDRGIFDKIGGSEI
jgi:hypothetical protein